MRITIHKISLHFLKKRFKNEVILAALILCIFTFLAAGIILFIDTYDTFYNSTIQQTHEVLEGASVRSGHKWWENKEIQLTTGRYQYNVDFMLYRTRIYDKVDILNEELRHKKILNS